MTIPVEFDPIYGCWLWCGADYKGYGRHTRVWDRLTGLQRRRGVHLDHICRRILCANPRHLEPVSASENQLRKSAWYRRRIERCPEGHRFTPETTLHTPEGGMVCTLCPREEPHG